MNYPYANGQIKALENNIFDKMKYSKLIKTPKEDYLKVLGELGYSHEANTLEEMINEELAEVKALIDKLSPQKQYTDLFFLANDALNIKVMYKKKLFNVNMDVFIGTGTISKELMKEAVFEGRLYDLPRDYQELFENINSSISGETNPRILSSKIDNCVYDFIFKRLNSAADALRKYFGALIDFTNVLTFIRCRRLNWDYSEFIQMYLNNGTISLYTFKTSYELGNDAVITNFRIYYFEKIVKGLKTYYESNDLSLLEFHLNSLLLEIMKEYKNDTFGIGPIIYYYLEKKAEATNIRLIYANNEIDLVDLIEY